MAGKREVAESCFEFLYLELVRTCYAKEEDGRGTWNSLQSMGFQVGQQLAERCAYLLRIILADFTRLR
eukprot:6730458-Pyramimonas_sp.AAC.2